MVPGGLMKAVIRPRGGDAMPSDGDQVIYDCTVRTLDGVVVPSTRSEFGGALDFTFHFFIIFVDFYPLTLLIS
ncbi:putative peptidylprolyl isomerase [Helianthus debilis subsp. tardiflorus]